jgi:ribosomal protein S18 acetylase RimI-like enzyme
MVRPVKITKASFEDIKTILLLQKQAFGSEADIYNDFDTSPPLLQTLEEITREFSGQTFLKAIVGNEIVGSVRGFQSGETGFIKRLVVHPQYQNQGIGSRLMESIEREFGKAKRYELFTGHRSARNLHLYYKLGYKEFKRERITSNLAMVFLEKCAQ